MAVPTKLPEWATAGTATKTEPSTQRKQQGWDEFQQPPYDFVNWWWNLVYQWILNAQEGSTSFDALGTMVDYLDPGDSGIVDEYDMDNAPGTLNTSSSTGAAIVSVDVSGTSVVYAETGAGDVEAVERDASTAVATYTKTNVGNNARIITDGQWTVLAYGQYVELFAHDTGVSQWVYDHGATVNDICLDGTRVYLVGDAGTGTHHARGITISTGLSAWDYDHGGNLESCATNGRQVFVAGAASSHGSGATLRALDASNGYDAANEGGTGADTLGIAWDVVQPTVITSGQRMACDGRSLYLGYSAAAPFQLETRGCYDGVIVAQATAPAEVYSVAVDHKLLVAAIADNTLRAFQKNTLAMAWTYLFTQAIFAGATDGCAAFAGANSGGAWTLGRLYRGNRPQLFHRADPDDQYLPYRQLAFSHE